MTRSDQNGNSPSNNIDCSWPTLADQVNRVNLLGPACKPPGLCTGLVTSWPKCKQRTITGLLSHHESNHPLLIGPNVGAN